MNLDSVSGDHLAAPNRREQPAETRCFSAFFDFLGGLKKLLRFNFWYHRGFPPCRACTRMQRKPLGEYPWIPPLKSVRPFSGGIARSKLLSVALTLSRGYSSGRCLVTFRELQSKSNLSSLIGSGSTFRKQAENYSLGIDPPVHTALSLRMTV